MIHKPKETFYQVAPPLQPQRRQCKAAIRILIVDDHVRGLRMLVVGLAGNSISKMADSSHEERQIAPMPLFRKGIIISCASA